MKSSKQSENYNSATQSALEKKIAEELSGAIQERTPEGDQRVITLIERLRTTSLDRQISLPLLADPENSINKITITTCAALYNRRKILLYLIKINYDITQPDPTNKTPLDYFCRNSMRNATAQLLLNHGVTFLHNIWWTTRYGDQRAPTSGEQQPGKPLSAKQIEKFILLTKNCPQLFAEIDIKRLHWSLEAMSEPQDRHETGNFYYLKAVLDKCFIAIWKEEIQLAEIYRADLARVKTCVEQGKIIEIPASLPQAETAELFRSLAEYNQQHSSQTPIATTLQQNILSRIDSDDRFKANIINSRSGRIDNATKENKEEEFIKKAAEFGHPNGYVQMVPRRIEMVNYRRAQELYLQAFDSIGSTSIDEFFSLNEIIHLLFGLSDSERLALKEPKIVAFIYKLMHSLLETISVAKQLSFSPEEKLLFFDVLVRNYDEYKKVCAVLNQSVIYTREKLYLEIISNILLSHLKIESSDALADIYRYSYLLVTECHNSDPSCISHLPSDAKFADYAALFSYLWNKTNDNFYSVVVTQFLEASLLQEELHQSSHHLKLAKLWLDHSKTIYSDERDSDLTRSLSYIAKWFKNPPQKTTVSTATTPSKSSSLDPDDETCDSKGTPQITSSTETKEEGQDDYTKLDSDLTDYAWRCYHKAVQDEAAQELEALAFQFANCVSSIARLTADQYLHLAMLLLAQADRILFGSHQHTAEASDQKQVEVFLAKAKGYAEQWKKQYIDQYKQQTEHAKSGTANKQELFIQRFEGLFSAQEIKADDDRTRNERISIQLDDQVGLYSLINAAYHLTTETLSFILLEREFLEALIANLNDAIALACDKLSKAEVTVDEACNDIKQAFAIAYDKSETLDRGKAMAISGGGATVFTVIGPGRSIPASPLTVKLQKLKNDYPIKPTAVLQSLMPR